MDIRLVRRLYAWPMLLLFIGCDSAKHDAANSAANTATNSANGATTVAVTSAALPSAIRYDQHIFVEGIPPAGAQLVNPFAGNSASATEGGKLFTSMNCDGCHGGGATGAVGPSLSDGRWRYGGSDGAVYQTIFYGRPQGMPAYGGVLQEPIIWKLVTYLKSLPVPAAVPTQSW